MNIQHTQHKNSEKKYMILKTTTCYWLNVGKPQRRTGQKCHTRQRFSARESEMWTDKESRRGMMLKGKNGIYYQVDKVKRSQFALLLSTLIKHFPLYNMDCQTKVCLQLSTHRRLIQCFRCFSVLPPQFYSIIFVSHFFFSPLFRSTLFFYLFIYLSGSAHFHAMRRMTIKSKWRCCH